jgi:hypothetical protein
MNSGKSYAVPKDDLYGPTKKHGSGKAVDSFSRFNKKFSSHSAEKPMDDDVL